MGQSRHHAVSAAILAATFLLAAAALPAARAQQETENQKEFSYVPGAANGPENWNRTPGWETCGKGEMQSPIDLSDKRVSLVPSLGYLQHSYRPAEASIVNRGHDIAVEFKGNAGSLVINGTAYILLQMHWHSPSEHTVNDRRYDMELHMVHQDAANKTAVIGLLYKVGRPDMFLTRLEPFLKKIADQKGRKEPIGVVDPREARGFAQVYYRYMGSLTTPPCKEGVIWTIVREVRTVSKHQLKLLREAVHDVSLVTLFSTRLPEGTQGMENNARPLQELNDRDIGLYDPKPRKLY